MRDIEITFCRSGDFQIAKRFGSVVLVKGKGTRVLRDRKLLLTGDRTDPPDYEGASELNVVSLTRLHLVYVVHGGKEQSTLNRVIKDGVEVDSPSPPSFNGSSDILERTVFVP